MSWLGTSLNKLDKRSLTKQRKDLQIVFQDPLASLDPRMTISASIQEPLKTFRPDLTSEERRQKVAECGTGWLEQFMINRYPHELSGGQINVSALPAR